MIEIGRNIRWYIPYVEEVEFSKRIGCTFMQIWFLKGEILIESNGKNKLELIKETNYPVVVHAVIDVVDFEEDVNNVIPILKELGLDELIIHPTCKVLPIDANTIYQLSESIEDANKKLEVNGIRLYIENNCRVTPINYSYEDVNIIFERNKEVSFLLDVAHIDNYDHLEKLVETKYPEMLHLADKHFSIDHEHLPVGEGEIDFKTIFNNVLKDFKGKLILEITQDNKSIQMSVEKIKSLLSDRI